MKVSVVGTDQVMEVEGPLAVGDILTVISTMAVVVVDEVADKSEVVLVATNMSGVKTSALFGNLKAQYVPEEVVEEKEVAEDGE